jgi:hypothetical protein
MKRALLATTVAALLSACGGAGDQHRSSTEYIDAHSVDSLAPGATYDAVLDHRIELIFDRGPIDGSRVRLQVGSEWVRLAPLLEKAAIGTSPSGPLTLVPASEVRRPRASTALADTGPGDGTTIGADGTTDPSGSTCPITFDCADRYRTFCWPVRAC